MTQIEMIQTQTTIEDTEMMLNKACTFRLNGGCGSGVKDNCFKMVMTSKCSKCYLAMAAEEHKKALLRQ